MFFCSAQSQEQMTLYEQHKQAFRAKKAEVDREGVMFADVMQSVSTVASSDDYFRCVSIHKSL